MSVYHILQHEDGSIAMLDHLIHTNNLWSSLEDYGLNLKDVVFIKELIYGPLPDSELSCQDRGLTNDVSGTINRAGTLHIE